MKERARLANSGASDLSRRIAASFAWQESGPSASGGLSLRGGCNSRRTSLSAAMSVRPVLASTARRVRVLSARLSGPSRLLLSGVDLHMFRARSAFLVAWSSSPCVKYTIASRVYGESQESGDSLLASALIDSLKSLLAFSRLPRSYQ